ncbi:hypothetical protein [Lacrimispora algidixylanolytica]|uniref:Cell wall-binding protein n=1 Tax=Lacrimispora algidixylanolytica TaxID=94868 RepID=A0A419T3S3_9FIRM|nr:hypothetical protein [Lacrimispora algidixylanolytica]RKD32038.1 hypothetical protein BET01_18685 [Lacrimispora algidixylanolytica]
MKKRLLGAILSTLLTVTMATPAFAEIIWTADKLPAGYTTNELENKDFSFYSGNAIKKDTYTYYVKDLQGNFMKNATFAGGSRTDGNGAFIYADGFVPSFGTKDVETNYILSQPYEKDTWRQDSSKSTNTNGISNNWYGDSKTSRYKCNWAWLMVAPDGKKDGLKYAYCFNEYGYLYTNTITPDGYMVNEFGQLMIDGKVKTINPREIIANYNNYPIGHLIYDPVTRAQREQTPNPFF